MAVAWSRARVGVDGGVFGCCGCAGAVVAGVRVRVEAFRPACVGGVCAPVGSARSLVNALTSSDDHGQFCWTRTICWRPVRMRRGRRGGGCSEAVSVRRSEWPVEAEQLGPGGEVLRGEDEFEPGHVRDDVTEREVLQTGLFRAADQVLDAGVLTVTASSAAMSMSVWSVMKHWNR